MKIKNASIVYGIFAIMFLIAACNGISEVYTPVEWVKMLKSAGGWTPLPFPDSKYRPGAIIKVTEADGVRWIDHLESCRYPEEVLKPENSYIPAITFTKGINFGADAIINIKGVSAGPSFENISKVGLEVKDHGADALKAIKLKVWLEEPENRKKVSSACMDELSKPNRYLVTEAFRVSKGTYTLYDKSGAAIKLSTPVLEKLLKFQPDIKYEIGSDGKLSIEQPVYFAIRKAVRIGDDIEVLGEETKKAETADAKIEKAFLKVNSASK